MSIIFQHAPIELKFLHNDPYDILSFPDIFWNSFEVIKGSQKGQKFNFLKMLQLSWNFYTMILKTF